MMPIMYAERPSRSNCFRNNQLPAYQQELRQIAGACRFGPILKHQLRGLIIDRKVRRCSSQQRIPKFIPEI